MQDGRAKDSARSNPAQKPGGDRREKGRPPRQERGRQSRSEQPAGGGAPIIGRLVCNLRGGGRILAPGDVLLAWLHDEAIPPALHGDTVEAKRTTGDRARVTRVIERARTSFVGVYQVDNGEKIMVPDDPKISFNFRIRTGGPALSRPPRVGDKVVLKMDEWTDPNVQPSGQLIELLGTVTDAGVDMLSVIRAHDLATDFPPECTAEADAFPERLPEEEIARREDCRRQFVLTIDPDDAKDHDDAIAVERTKDGWLLSIHIADVAHYVRPGSALDVEAKKRGNSTYLADRTIPMLPFRLSADLCSLRAGVERFAHTVFLDLTPHGRVRGARFARTVILVHSRLTYRQAMAMINGETVPGFVPEVPENVRLSWELAKMMRAHRFAEGSLDLDFPEIKVWLDATGRVDRLERVVSDASHQLVEECMLAANEAVAHEIKNRPAACIYRVHDKPDPERLADLRHTLGVNGVRVGDLTNRNEVTKLLAALRGRTDEARLKIEFLKSLRRAAYSPDPIGHYGLSKADYLHFTSPIRRYADLVAHRVLAREKTGGRREFTEIAEHLSETERTSAAAEKESVLVKKIEYFQRQLDEKNLVPYRALVTDVKAHGLLVELPDADTFGLVPAVLLPGGPFQFDNSRTCFVNRRTNASFKLGDTLQVVIARVDPARRTMDFAPVQGGRVDS